MAPPRILLKDQQEASPSLLKALPKARSSLAAQTSQQALLTGILSAAQAAAAGKGAGELVGKGSNLLAPAPPQLPPPAHLVGKPVGKGNSCNDISKTNAKLFLGGISQDSTEQSLRSYFTKFGPNECAIMMDQQTGNSRGFGFVTFDNSEHAASCCAEGRLHCIDGKAVEVKLAEAKGVLPMSTGPAKLFIGGIPQGSTEQSLRSYFTEFGPLNDCVIMMDQQTGNSRGFGFVTFDNSEDAASCCAEGRLHCIDGKAVEVRPAEARGAPAMNTDAAKLFLGGIPQGSTEQSLRSYLTKFGPLKECVIMMDHQTGNSRGFGFVTFDNSVDAASCCAEGRLHCIDGKAVEVRPCEARGASAMNINALESALEQELFSGSKPLASSPVACLRPPPPPPKKNTVFIANLPPDADEFELLEICYSVGSASEVKIMRHHDGSSKGCAMCDFSDESEVILAVEDLDGTEYKGYKLRFEPGNQSSKTKVFITNLPDDADEHEVEQLCSRAGTAFGCRLIRTADGKCKGYGYVFFDRRVAEIQDSLENELLCIDYNDCILQFSLQGGPGVIKDTVAKDIVPPPPPVSNAAGMTDIRPGDWICSSCQRINYSSRAECFKCAAPRPSGRQDVIVTDEVVEQLKTVLCENEEAARASSASKCKMGYDCKQATCDKVHPDGRACCEDPKSIICRFLRRCKRQDCFFHHPSGRDIDDGTADNLCNRGIDCDRPDCVMRHPDGWQYERRRRQRARSRSPRRRRWEWEKDSASQSDDDNDAKPYRNDMDAKTSSLTVLRIENMNCEVTDEELSAIVNILPGFETVKLDEKGEAVASQRCCTIQFDNESHAQDALEILQDENLLGANLEMSLRARGDGEESEHRGGSGKRKRSDDDTSEERRIAEDGKAYTYDEFKSCFKGRADQKWNEAKPDSKQQLDDEKRIAEDGKAYTYRQFKDCYKGRADEKWSKALPDSDGSVSGSAAQPKTEKRIAEDGKAYTFEEFQSCFKSKAEQKWNEARPDAT
eukprot:TRINITY_DN10828_c0_g1_i1.p1 TRINITY_DN10828_c0_g1~~TRINITY_DN10828_c0_g1_i1.p1  ORF type:complete len:1007 (-),score=187.36 TRINITY_DN10828_c0_g1_i1:188-3208(-)